MTDGSAPAMQFLGPPAGGGHFSENSPQAAQPPLHRATCGKQEVGGGSAEMRRLTLLLPGTQPGAQGPEAGGPGQGSRPAGEPCASQVILGCVGTVALRDHTLWGPIGT